MAFYDEMAAMALQMITEYGQTVTLRNFQRGDYDPEASAPVPVSYTHLTLPTKA